MTLNRQQLLTDQEYRREVITQLAAEVEEAVKNASLPPVDTEWTARDLIARFFDVPEFRDREKYPA